MELKKKAHALPQVPGVYLFKNNMDQIIYVGKSKNLRSRVSQYFIKSNTRWAKVEEMVRNIHTFDYKVTDTELEALLLECHLIKTIKPLYNRQMKNTGKYLYLEITMGDIYPRLKTAINRDNPTSLYFGPFNGRSMVENAIAFFHDAFPIRRCSCPSGTNTGCLDYHLGNCIGPCRGEISKEQYHIYIQSIISFLEGKEEQLLIALSEKMEQASADMAFEKAVKYRDMISGTRSLLNRQHLIQSALLHKSIVALEAIEGAQAKLFLIRHNKLLYSERTDADTITMKQLKSTVLKHLKQQMPYPVTSFDKQDIDEVQIVHSYLKKHHEHLITVEIPDDVVSGKNISNLQQILKPLFTKISPMP